MVSKPDQANDGGCRPSRPGRAGWVVAWPEMAAVAVAALGRPLLGDAARGARNAEIAGQPHQRVDSQGAHGEHPAASCTRRNRPKRCATIWISVEGVKGTGPSDDARLRRYSVVASLIRVVQHAGGVSRCPTCFASFPPASRRRLRRRRSATAPRRRRRERHRRPRRTGALPGPIRCSPTSGSSRRRSYPVPPSRCRRSCGSPTSTASRSRRSRPARTTGTAAASLGCPARSW